MIVNAYTCYRAFHVAQGTKTKNILSQYDFRHSLSLAWMNPEEYWKTKRSGKRTMDFATEESRKRKNRAYTESENKPVRAPSLSTSSLDVRTGKLKCRANIHGLAHFPAMPTIRDPTCACHRWENSKRIYSSKFFCKVCKVNLCINCFEKFHTIHNVEELRHSAD